MTSRFEHLGYVDLFEEKFNRAYIKKEKLDGPSALDNNLVCIDNWKALIGDRAKLYVFISTKGLKDVQLSK